eukprot:scaffold118435_cov54-Phaeocystis_antarctica.AAC.1
METQFGWLSMPAEPYEMRRHRWQYIGDGGVRKGLLLNASRHGALTSVCCRQLLRARVPAPWHRRAGAEEVCVQPSGTGLRLLHELDLCFLRQRAEQLVGVVSQHKARSGEHSAVPSQLFVALFGRRGGEGTRNRVASLCFKLPVQYLPRSVSKSNSYAQECYTVRGRE